MGWTGLILGILAVAIAVLFAVWDWNWFRGPIERLASARMHRNVTITGDLNADIWSWQPSATIDGVHIANPAWALRGSCARPARSTAAAARPGWSGAGSGPAA